MTFSELLDSERFWSIMTGAAGAAAIATTDWNGWRRFLRHMLVGTLTAAAAGPSLAPPIAKAFGFLPLDDAALNGGAVFIVGGFGLYFFEFALAFAKAKTKYADMEARRRTQSQSDQPASGEQESGQ